MRSPPGSPTPLERPSKRALFALDSSATPSPIIQQNDLFGAHNNPSEDWGQENRWIAHRKRVGEYW
ncbi:hypothetical protein FIBSPDRAFT_970071 [Athelia psychrophila]|uniref:Uncharacterized protein n=1 Tax=Athelia psychrophila TaxID=1759441 RepID=A0A167SYR1_9AGAM|nr:hypothetical protein FIBSPDRAFT_970071 [Fibularhizoctonia sp. CBS 109695]